MNIINRLIPWLPLIIALVATYGALLQIRLNNVNKMRIDRLTQLKELITDLISEEFVIQMEKGIVLEFETNTNRNSPATTDMISYINNTRLNLIERLKIIQTKENLIKLNIIPSVGINRILENHLNVYMETFNRIPTSVTTAEHYSVGKILDQQSNLLITICRYIFEIELEKIRRNKISFWIYVNLGRGNNLLGELSEIVLNKKAV